jgi:hypothetical protein
MADKLTIYAGNNYLFYLQWEVELDDGELDMGATLCEGARDGLGKPPTDRGDWENWMACKTVRELPNFQRDDRGAYFESRTEAQKALAVIKLAWKQDRPLPEWATKALAEGWKPPNNWKA